MKSKLYGALLLLSLLNFVQLHAQQLTTGDEFSYTDSEGVTRTFVVTGENIISNPSFDDGVAGWTGGNGGTIQDPIVNTTGGVDNGAYIVPTTNSSLSDDHSLVTYWEIQKGKNYVFSFFVKRMNDNVAVAKEGYIEAVQTNVKHDSQKIYNILHAHEDANGVWTQNLVVTEAQYQYLGFVARWLDSNLGFDAFILAEVEETLTSAKHRLSLLIEKCEDKIDECESSIEEHETPIRLAIFTEIIDECKDILALEDVVTSQVLELITKLEYALLDFSMANFVEGEAIDVTRYYVKNPGFDHMFTDWELNNPMYSEDGVDKGSNMRFLKHFGAESREAEIFVDPAKDTHISQTIKNIPNGYYNFILDCVMTHNVHGSEEKSGVAVYCNNGEADVRTLNDTKDSGGNSTDSYPERFSVQGIVAENILTIGMVGYATSNFSYAAFDNIKLEYVGKLTSFAELTYLINKAKNTLESYENPIGYDEFRTTIYSIENNSDNNKSDEEIVSMINRLKNAIEHFVNLNTIEIPDSTWVYYITASVADSLAGKIETASTCNYGDTLVIDILPNENYELDTLLVNGVNVAKLVENNKFVIESVTSDIVIYAAFSPVCYLTLQYADNGCIKQQVIKGHQYRFTLLPAEGWNIHTVTFNGDDVTSRLEDGNVFTTPTLLGEAVLNISYEEDGAAVESAYSNAVKVYGVDGMVNICGLKCGDNIEIYTTEGLLVCNQVAEAANTSIIVDAGQMYVVKVADKVVKIHM